MIKRLYHWCWSVCLRHPLIVAFLLLFSLDAFGRAGGGGSYSGGGSSSGGGGGFSGGGGGGDGDGIFIIIWVLIRLAIEYPAIGIPAALIGIPLVIFIGYKSQNSATTYHRGRVIHRVNDLRQEHDLLRGLSDIQNKHSDFKDEAFLKRVETAFMKIQEAWCQQQLNTVRPFISDGIFERFTLQFQEQRESGVRDHMEDIRILNRRVAHAEVGKVFETLTVRIQASAIDYRVDLNTGKYVEGNKRPDTFVEYWTFIRKPGAEERNDKGLIEGNCPNCGAGLEVNESAKCNACQALIKGGEYDWILSEITQECEWRSQSTTTLPGVDKVRRKDKLFSVQQLEDRASVIFWRYATSYRTGKTGPIRKMATDACCTAIEERFTFNDDGQRFIPGNVAVGAVDTLGIAVGEPRDKALVRVRWSAARVAIDRAGKTKTLSASNVINDIFVLERKHGAAGVQEGALSSAHCAGCGAPVSNEASDACEYCGTVLNDGNTDWVLSHIGKEHETIVQDIRKGFYGGLSVAKAGTPIRTDISSREVAAWMIKVMLADGTVDTKERAQLDAYGSARHISKSDMDRMIEAATQGRLDCPEPRSPEEAQQWIRSMARMALADGFVSKDEEQALLLFGKRLSYAAYDIRRLIKEEQKLLYKESKQAMRQIKTT